MLMYFIESMIVFQPFQLHYITQLEYNITNFAVKPWSIWFNKASLNMCAISNIIQYNRIKIMSLQRLTIVRLQKQQQAILKEPIPNLLVARKGLLNFHFCIYGLEEPYQGGFYHGVLQLAADYPFSPPKLKFFTQSGRFQTNKAICTSFTNFHKQQWSSAWTVRSMLLGMVSFMLSSQGGYGSFNDTASKRKALAQKSLERNMQNPEFVQLFKQQLQNLSEYKNRETKKTQLVPVSNHPNNVQNSNLIMYILGIILIILIFGYGVFRNDFIKFFGKQNSRQF